MKIIAIIPAYNEEKRVAASVRDASQFVHAVVVVDDCSADATYEVAQEAGAVVLRHPMNRGQGAALQTGTDYALQDLGADVIVHFDADGQMRGEDIPFMVEPIKNSEAHIVLGSRFLGEASEGMPFIRKMTLLAGIMITWMISGIRVSDTHNGFRALSKEAAETMRITLDRMAHASEILDQIQVNKIAYTERAVRIRYTEETLAKGNSVWTGFVILKDVFKDKFFH